ncbi:sugar kinase [Maricaulis maris]|jgi:2-dehydro-3-deoxygluconokinase|uniref:2-keto-3-deoxygluconate kinase n=1 Tax=Maricaulis maris (strain MCS10) TaxID=394221 RepID=Q0AT34_MARMM|nr:sugar kinase [Maricaulis maris]ABI64553.1 2-keto-3-deoxygluconate kinase [Maricaulis maris MCS10]
MNAMGHPTKFKADRKAVTCFGEVMAELADLGAEQVRVGVGGDTFNTAVYLARLGTPVRYATALGQDPFSERIRKRMALEGVDAELVATSSDRNCGLYAIEVDETGERSFTYWRSHSAARQFFDLAGARQALDAMAEADVLYLSGITLSLFAESSKTGQIIDLAQSVRRKGGQVVFDTNYRPAGWLSPGQARDTICELMPHISIALPTLEDEQALFGFQSVEECVEYWCRAGVDEVVVKHGPRGAWSTGVGEWVEPPAIIAPVDTTGAGDSFNAGYLHARLSGASGRESIIAAHQLAALVLGVRGALLPADEPLPAWTKELSKQNV